MTPALPDHTARERAAADLDTNLVVTAGAGTGKTSLLVERLLMHLLERGTPLERLVAVTFTRKAAAEMRERLEDALERVSQVLVAAEPEPLGPDSEADRVLTRLRERALPEQVVLERARQALATLDSASIGTLHGLAGDLLRRHHVAAGVDLAFTVDEDGQARDELFDELWREHLRDSPRTEDGAASWRTLLETVGLHQAQELARALLSPQHELPWLEGESAAGQERIIDELLDAVSRDIAEIRALLAGADGANRNLPERLDGWEAAVSALRERPFRPSSAALDVGGSVPSAGARIDLAESDLARLKEALSRVHGKLTSILGCDPRLGERALTVLLPLVRRFREEYRRRGFISQDGLIVEARDLLRDRIDVRRAEQQRIDHLLLDEFQDTDPRQYEIAFFLTESAADAAATPVCRDAYSLPLEPGRLFIVGDAKQSIYRFRGADIEAYERAVRTVERSGGAVLTLSANFRSVPQVIEPLNRLFAESFSAPSDPSYDALRPMRAPSPDTGDLPTTELWSIEGRNGPAGNVAERRALEAEAIADGIANEVATGRHRSRDFALLFRATNQLDPYLRALRDRGLDYVFESAKGFFQRHEVELFVSLLRLVVDPADSVALMTCLRSPLGAVPDSELLRWRQPDASSQRPRPTSSRALLDPPELDELPALSRALRTLGSFVQSTHGGPLEVAARLALDSTPLRLTFAAFFEGAQRVANLEKVVRRIEELAWREGLHAEEILAWIEREEGRTKGEGDAPLADETVDAITVMTIHKSKGLEWPVVFLPDIGAQPSSSSRASVEVSWHVAAGGPDERRSLALSLGSDAGLRTPARAARTELETAHEDAERKRLLYVATTRARERLILPNADSKTRDRSMLSLLAPWRYEPQGAFPDVETLCGGQIIHRRVKSAGTQKNAPPRDEPESTPILRAARSHLARVARLRERVERATRVRAMSSRDARHDDGVASLEHSGPRGLPRPLARAVGSAVHHLLERRPREASADWLLEHAAAAARVAAAREEVDAGEVERHTIETLSASLRSGRLAEILAQAVIAREIPALVLREDGDIDHGVIDAVVGTLGEPRVVDYKTDRSTPEEALGARHEAQISRYAEALRRALGLEHRPPSEALGLFADGPHGSEG